MSKENEGVTFLATPSSSLQFYLAIKATCSTELKLRYVKERTSRTKSESLLSGLLRRSRFDLYGWNYLEQSLCSDHRSFVKIIHRKKHSQKSAFWKRGTAVLKSCLNGGFEIDIESKWVYSHIKLSSNFRYVLIQVRTQFDMPANPL